MVYDQFILLPVQNPQQGFGGGGQGYRPQNQPTFGQGVATPPTVRPAWVVGQPTAQPAFGAPFGLRPDQSAGFNPQPFPQQGGFNPMSQSIDRLFAMIDQLIQAALAMLSQFHHLPLNGQDGLQNGLEQKDQDPNGFDQGPNGFSPGHRPDGGASFQQPRFGADKPYDWSAQPPLIAADKKALAYGDPHIKGAGGEKFDFNDLGIYNVLQDKGLAINAEMAPAAGEKSVITNIGLKAGNQQLQLLPNGQVIIDGKPVDLQQGQQLQLQDGTVISKEGKDIKLKGREYDVTFKSRAKGQYFDVAVKSKSQGVAADGVLPTGILGETFDGDETAGSATKHQSAFYRRQGLFAF